MFELVLAALLLGAEPPPAVCDVSCERAAAQALLASGDVDAAIASLKGARRRFPEERVIALLLARAYLAEGNLFWAERTLRDALARWPEDRELHDWLVVVHLRQGDPELAAAAQGELPRPESDPEAARWSLLGALQARLAGDPERAADAVVAIGTSRRLYVEDLQLWRQLMAKVDPWRTEPISVELELGAGLSSNALAGSPTDPGASGDASGLGLVELRSRFVAPRRARLRPLVEVELLGDRIVEEAYQELSSLQGGLRLGAAVVAEQRRLTFAYRTEGLWLDQEDALFSAAHRAEVEIEWLNRRVLFAGAGHREYRDDRRTRWEAELGVGGPAGALGRLPLAAGATVRGAAAESSAYDQIGVSAVLSGQLPVGRSAALRLALSATWDDYLNSGGEEGQLVFGTEERRRDLLARLKTVLWASPWHGLRTGLELRYSARDSTADEAPGFDFSYTEWRAVLWLRVDLSGNPWAPRVVAGDPGRVPVDWGLDDERGLDEERILDLLRRDEELRRGSSCGVR